MKKTKRRDAKASLKNFYKINNSIRTENIGRFIPLDRRPFPGSEAVLYCRSYSTYSIVRDGHGGGWSRKINAWHLYTLMVYL